MGYALPVTVQMTDMSCPVCGIQYAIPEGYRTRKYDSGDSWHCPNGHSLSYHENEAKRLRKQLDAANRTNTELTQRVREAQEAEQKAESERRRIIRRAKAGVCPCCNRTFQNLQRHMATKHKDADVSPSVSTSERS